MYHASGETASAGGSGSRRPTQSFGSVTPRWPWYFPALSL